MAPVGLGRDPGLAGAFLLLRMSCGSPMKRTPIRPPVHHSHQLQQLQRPLQNLQRLAQYLQQAKLQNLQLYNIDLYKIEG